MHWSRADAPASAAAFGARAGERRRHRPGRRPRPGRRRRACASSSGFPGFDSSRWRAVPRRSPASDASGDPRIRYVEPVTLAQPAHVRNDPLTYEIDPRTGAPYEWQFHAVGTDQALNLGRGDPSILVGVLDTGVTAVPDLAGKIAETFWDPAATTSAGDALGHGTFVASIIASRNDDGRGLAGFCGACRLAVYKAPRLTNVQVAEGIRTLTDAHVRVINLSIVLDAPSQAVIDALNYATAAGVLVVAAAGNDGQSAIDFPASYLQPPGGSAGPGLAVGASDRAGSARLVLQPGPTALAARARHVRQRLQVRRSSGRSRPRRPLRHQQARARWSCLSSTGRATPTRAGRATQPPRSPARPR